MENPTKNSTKNSMENPVGNSMETILKIDNIEKYYGNKSNMTKAIDGISFDVEAGEFVAIMGASGSGKTTLLNCVSTIDKVSSGHIYVGGKDITTLKGNKLNEFRREELGFIFQDFNLLDTLTAYENVALALSIQNVPAKQIDAKVRAVAKELEIESVLKKYPYQMSGGQKQRVASARAIITDPKLVLADEPSTKAVVCGVVAGIASLAAIIGGIFGIAGSNKVAKASAIVVWAAFLVILAIISGIVTLVSGDSKLIAVVMMIVGIVVPVVMFMGAAKNRTIR